MCTAICLLVNSMKLWRARYVATTTPLVGGFAQDSLLLVQLLDDTDNAEHCVVIFKRFICDASEKHALPLFQLAPLLWGSALQVRICPHMLYRMCMPHLRLASLICPVTAGSRTEYCRCQQSLSKATQCKRFFSDSRPEV